MNFKNLFTALFILSITACTQAQEPIFPDLHGQALLDALKQNYKPTNVLGYGPARDVMYAYIDNENNSVSCVYSGYTITVPYGVSNPRNYTNGASPIINTEHTWPQSKGAASGNAKSDLHHLFPCNEVPNGGRGSLKFGESNDNATDRWYLNTSVLTSIPSQSIDDYSELNSNDVFEPREDHKGNVARAMFYFYTMYKAEADAQDPTFFNAQKDVLRQWNSMDPVDAAELARTNQIAGYQDLLPNPFVIDTTLIGRAYFGVVTGIEDNVSALADDFQLYGNYPNPFNPETTIKFALKQAGDYALEIFNLNGSKIREFTQHNVMAGNHTVVWDGYDAQGQPAASGIYIYRLTTEGGFLAKKMFLIR